MDTTSVRCGRQTGAFCVTLADKLFVKAIEKKNLLQPLYFEGRSIYLVDNWCSERRLYFCEKPVST